RSDVNWRVLWLTYLEQYIDQFWNQKHQSLQDMERL
ncbi:MAG: hypothetical protein ACJAYJ_003534, partial [Saprospiraceae bacterium]